MTINEISKLKCIVKQKILIILFTQLSYVYSLFEVWILNILPNLIFFAGIVRLIHPSII